MTNNLHSNKLITPKTYILFVPKQVGKEKAKQEESSIRIKILLKTSRELPVYRFRFSFGKDDIVKPPQRIIPEKTIYRRVKLLNDSANNSLREHQEYMSIWQDLTEWWFEIVRPQHVIPNTPQIIFTTNAIKAFTTCGEAPTHRNVVYPMGYKTGPAAASGALAPRTCREGRINKLNEEKQSYATYQCNRNGR